MSCMFHVSWVVHTCYMWVVDVRLWMSMCCVLLSICIVCLRERPVTTLSGVIPARSFQANEFSWPIKKQQMKFVNVLPQETFPAAHCWGPKFRFQLCFSAMCCLCVVFRHIVELVWLCFLLCFCVKIYIFAFVCVLRAYLCALWHLMHLLEQNTGGSISLPFVLIWADSLTDLGVSCFFHKLERFLVLCFPMGLRLQTCMAMVNLLCRF